MTKIPEAMFERTAKLLTTLYRRFGRGHDLPTTLPEIEHDDARLVPGAFVLLNDRAADSGTPFMVLQVTEDEAALYHPNAVIVLEWVWFETDRSVTEAESVQDSFITDDVPTYLKDYTYPKHLITPRHPLHRELTKIVAVGALLGGANT